MGSEGVDLFGWVGKGREEEGEGLRLRLRLNGRGWMSLGCEEVVGGLVGGDAGRRVIYTICRAVLFYW